MNPIDILSFPEKAFAHVYSANSYRNHFSPANDTIEISFITEGYTVMQKGTRTFRAEKGDVICLIRDSDIKISSDDFHCHHTVCAHVNWTPVPNNSGLLLPMITKSCAETEDILQMIDRFIYQPYLYENSKGKWASAFLNILCKIDKINASPKEIQQPENILLTTRAKKYIHANLHRPITQQEVAQHLNISPQHLCHVFKNAEGITLIKYVNMVKLKNIHALMQKENLKLYEAAQIYGYTDANYVSALYKKTFGRSITSPPDIADK